jgi:hypothetical protein
VGYAKPAGYGADKDVNVMGLGVKGRHPAHQYGIVFFGLCRAFIPDVKGADLL